MQLVVIDFEATCDEPYNPVPQEVIEFPAVLIDPDDLARAAEFHSWVRPVVHPALTRFCRELTGADQHQIDSAPAFPEVLGRFEEWRSVHVAPDALSVTCGDWDLGSLLPRQCAQHRLAVPPWADHWADLKQLFARQSPGADQRTTLAGMAEALNEPLAGRAHSGIDDARNITRVLRRLLALGVSVVPTSGWRCPGCGHENLYRERRCRHCDEPAVRLRPGDWACPVCGFANFAARRRCYDCGAAHPGPAGGEFLRGDWLCPDCGEHNFARRRRCFRCGR